MQFITSISNLFQTLYNWIQLVIGASGGTIIAFVFLKAQWGETDDDSGANSKKHISKIVRIVIWTLGGIVASTIFKALVPNVKL